LLENSLTKQLKITNACAIPVEWKLLGVDTLPEAFTVSKKQGQLKPCQEEVLDIVFKSSVPTDLKEKLTLEVQDTEGFGIKQENQVIELKAEAFQITLDIKMSHD